MILTEIFTPTTSIRQVKAPFNGTGPKPLKRIPVGNQEGAYSAVYPAASDPTQVTKSNLYPVNLEHDAYFNYVRTMAKLAAENPFFPRIYNINVKRDSTGDYHVRYQMERLRPLNMLPPEVLHGMLVGLFDTSPSAFDSGRKIAALLNRAVEENDLSHIKDDQLAKAVELISRLSDQYRYSPDIHIDNIMVRVTSVGPQLVITDPLSDLFDSVTQTNRWRRDNPTKVTNSHSNTTPYPFRTTKKPA